MRRKFGHPPPPAKKEKKGNESCMSGGSGNKRHVPIESWRREPSLSRTKPSVVLVAGGKRGGRKRTASLASKKGKKWSQPLVQKKRPAYDEEKKNHHTSALCQGKGGKSEDLIHTIWERSSLHNVKNRPKTRQDGKRTPIPGKERGKGGVSLKKEKTPPVLTKKEQNRFRNGNKKMHTR